MSPSKSRQIGGGLESILSSKRPQSPAAAAAAERTPTPEPTSPAPVPARTVAADPAPADTPVLDAATAPATPQLQPAPAPTARITARYDELVRKEARFRDDQLSALSVASRRLQRSRPSDTPGERITDNTLIRVAVDMLLAHADHLSGHTEAEILASAQRLQGEQTP